MLPQFLFILAIVLFLVSAFVPESWHSKLVCFGFSCFAAAEMFSKFTQLMH